MRRLKVKLLASSGSTRGNWPLAPKPLKRYRRLGLGVNPGWEVEMDDLLARVDRLERENRRLKLTTGALVAALAGAALLGAVWPQEIPETIAAQAIAVLDDDGNPRILLDANGVFYGDENGTTRVGLGMDENGTAFIRVYGVRGEKQRISLGVNPNDSAALSFGDAPGIVRAVLGVGSRGAPLLSLRNREGTPVAELEAFQGLDETTPRARLAFLDHARGIRFAAFALQDGTPIQLFFDAEGNVIWQAPR